MAYQCADMSSAYPSSNTRASSSSSSKKKCPQCGGHDHRRSRRRGFEHVLSVIGLFPYRCDTCSHRFVSLLHETAPRGSATITGSVAGRAPVAPAQALSLKSSARPSRARLEAAEDRQSFSDVALHP